MYYGEIKKVDIADGPGTRVSLFVSGCRRHCRDCFNEQTWDFCFGQPFTVETEQEILTALSPSYIHGLTVLGGEPFEPENQGAVLALLQKVRRAYPRKTIWCYTGDTLECDLLAEGGCGRCAETDALLALIDVLVDGAFVAEERDLSLRFRGSRNQRLIDLQPTLRTGNVVLWEEE